MSSSGQLPPRAPLSTHRSGYRRSASNASRTGQSRGASRTRHIDFVIPRSASHDIIDSSHLDGIHFECERLEQEEQQQRGEDGGLEQERNINPSKSQQAKRHKKKVGITTDDPDDPSNFTPGEERVIGRHGGYSAEEIALRRFMTTVAWGGGLNVVKHNRGRGRARRLLKFNDEEGYLCWCSTFHKTKVPTRRLLKASRVGGFVTVNIMDEADVTFECSRLTDAIVLEVGLNGIIRVEQQQQ